MADRPIHDRRLIHARSAIHELSVQIIALHAHILRMFHCCEARLIFPKDTLNSLWRYFGAVFVMISVPHRRLKTDFGLAVIMPNSYYLVKNATENGKNRPI